MIALPPVIELTLAGVADSGVPNRERIILKSTQSVNIGQFGLLLAWKSGENYVTPMADGFFWFGDQIIAPSTWVIVYTGSGTPQISKIPPNDEVACSVHWGRGMTIFNVPEIVPVLFRINEIIIGRHFHLPASPPRLKQ
jgi:hypothetical protein